MEVWLRQFAHLDPLLVAGLAVALAVVAFLYSSVGHAGASGYIAVMSLAGIAAEVFRPVALVLNILVASVAGWQFWRAGHFDGRLLWPFASTAIPAGFVGGSLVLPVEMFKLLVGLVLVCSAAWLLARPGDDQEPRQPRLEVALGVGAAIGLLAGLTGTGGGIFLTPVLLLCGWARARNAAAVSAVFILLVSLAGLAGQFQRGVQLPPLVVPLAAAVLVGGTAGSWLGSRRLDGMVIRRILAVVLIIAGLKMMLVEDARPKALPGRGPASRAAGVS